MVFRVGHLVHFGRSVGAVRPSVGPSADRRRIAETQEGGVGHNERTRPPERRSGQVREGEAAPVGMYGHMSPVSVRPSSDVEGPQTATDDAEVQPWISFLLLKKQLRFLFPFLQITR